MRRIFIVLLVVAALISMVAGAVFAYTYRAPYTVSENSTVSYDMLAVNASVNNTWLAVNGFINLSGNDTRVETLGGLAKPHMLADNKTLTAVPVALGSQTNLYYTFGNSELSAMYVIPGYDGYITVADNTTLELGDNFTIEMKGWIDTDYSSDKFLISKTGAFSFWISATENITFGLADVDCLNYVNGNADHTDVADHNDFSFTDGNDIPFTIIFSMEADDITDGDIISKWLPGQREWSARLDAAGRIVFMLRDLAVAKWIGRQTDVQVVDTPYRVAITYDGTEVVGGINIYVDGVDADTGDLGEGVYVGMSNGTSPVTLGMWGGGGGGVPYDGDLNEIRIYDVELTPAEVLDDYNGTFKETDLVAYWPVSEGAGLPQDTSGNGHHAYFNNADWATNPSLGRAGGAEVGVTGISSEEYTATVTANVTHLELDVGGTSDIEPLPAGVVDGSQDWVFVADNSMPYAEYIKISINNTLRLWFQPTSIISGTTMPDRATSVANDGVITWGANPAGVNVTFGSLVSASTPTPGVTAEAPTVDYLPAVNPSDWYEEPDVTGALLTNPLRPFVTILSDTTTLSELLAWRLLALAAILMGTAAAGRAVRGHLIIAGIVCGVLTGGAVALTIFPLWALVFAITAILAGAISERSHSL